MRRIENLDLKDVKLSDDFIVGEVINENIDVRSRYSESTA